MKNKKRYEMKIDGRCNGQSIENSIKFLDYIDKLPANKMYGILKLKGITILTKDEVISKNKIENIKNKLINFEFQTDSYKDLNFISEIINDLNELLEV